MKFLWKSCILIQIGGRTPTPLLHSVVVWVRVCVRVRALFASNEAVEECAIVWTLNTPPAYQPSVVITVVFHRLYRETLQKRVKSGGVRTTMYSISQPRPLPCVIYAGIEPARFEWWAPEIPNLYGSASGLRSTQVLYTVNIFQVFLSF